MPQLTYCKADFANIEQWESLLELAGTDPENFAGDEDDYSEVTIEYTDITVE